MKWFSIETEYDESRLLLRYPDYSNIWDNKTRFSYLLNIKHDLEKVRNDGLPEAGYNSSLINFDSPSDSSREAGGVVSKRHNRYF